jgi:hypothetical protein
MHTSLGDSSFLTNFPLKSHMLQVSGASVPGQHRGAAMRASGLERETSLRHSWKTCSQDYAERSLKSSREIIDSVRKTNPAFFVRVARTSFHSSIIFHTGYATIGSLSPLFI